MVCILFVCLHPLARLFWDFHCPVYKPSIPFILSSIQTSDSTPECVSSFTWKRTPDTAIFGHKQSAENTHMSHEHSHEHSHEYMLSFLFGADWLVHMVITWIFLVSLRKCQAIFSSGYHVMFPGVMEEHSSGSTSLSTLDVVRLVNLRCVEESSGLICVACWLTALNIFSCVVCHLWWAVLSNLRSIFYCLSYFSNSDSLIHNLGTSSLSAIQIANIFLPAKASLLT